MLNICMSDINHYRVAIVQGWLHAVAGDEKYTRSVGDNPDVSQKSAREGPRAELIGWIAIDSTRSCGDAGVEYRHIDHI